jgi:NAD(P)-dependent dehydrogenase (short-subunit alcohol dehydrogenase family)
MKKSIVITGASSGFGKLMVETLSKDGHLVFATMRGVNGKNKSQADAIASWAIENKVDVHLVEMDVTNDESVHEAAKTILAKSATIDVVVNNAGIYGGGLDETFSVQDYKNIYEVNVFGVLRVVRAFLPAMRANKAGLFVQISSLMGRFVIPYAGAYTSSKWAVEAIAENLRYELAPFGIDSVIVEPGAFPTEIFTKMYQPENAAIATEYEPAMPYLQGFGKAFHEMMSGEVPNKPQQIADAVKILIDTPNGERPQRVPVDLMMGNPANTINDAQAQVQSNFLTQMGLVDLLHPKK